MKTKIDINCDLGESYGEFKVGNDTKIMPHITSANIACGFHAGDPTTIARTIDLAKNHNVAIGAHPSYPDLMGFGRRELQLTSEEAKNYIIYQVSALRGFAKTANATLQHVKPHGALYNTAVKNEMLSKAIVEAVKAMDNRLMIFAPSNSVLAKVAANNKLHVAHEFFADRAYNNDGSLVSRRQPDAIIREPTEVVERVIKAVRDGTVVAIDSELVNLGDVHTVCVHGDNSAAVELAKAIRIGLAKANIEVKPAGSFV
jgi:UPF0271 protein